ncbi:hypothetical protein P22_1619 [Propionispora sp. 2/2-37]|uniref:hypothetical protein n=1 Tax=Propionispora sp. 2/2-37 TaxID=1677858 RepID=UPI0006BB8935|nr:hypothetical protein [Propionispora sp. 2/2-37]CUH95548.1 hypothetical protein P22_1619 [Propionispora sp. 2/2-37]
MLAKIFYSVLFVISLSITNVDICLASINASELSQEAAWISLDLPVEQRKQIDNIIVQTVKEAQIKHISPKIASLDYAQIFTLTNYLNEISDIRETINNQIMQVLPPQQRQLFEAQLEKKQHFSEQTTALILSLNLSDKQQIAIINSLLRCQNQALSIVSNQSLSWEERRKKLKKANPLRLISRNLTKAQLADLMLWSKSH